MGDKKKFLDVEFTPEFKRNLRSLKKKYCHIKPDIEPVIDQIKDGHCVGSQIPKTGNYTIFKVRIRNSDINKGKSSGYRIIYYVKSDEKIILITIYSKTKQTNITHQRILRILKNDNIGNI